MKKVSALFICVIFFNCFSPYLSFSKDYKETIRLVTGPWAPFTGKDLPNYGTAAINVAEAFTSQDIKVEYTFRPWKRAFEEAKKGNFDGSILWRRTPEREQNFYFSDPVVTVEVVFFHLKSFSFDWNSLKDLKDKKILIGVVIGLQYENEFDDNVKSGVLLAGSVTTQEQNLKKLLAGRIHITPMIRESGYATINKEFSPEDAALFTHHSVPLATHTLHLILSKKIRTNRRIMASFNEGLKISKNLNTDHNQANSADAKSHSAD